ncbi:beta-N-acetylhexosaminidase [Actinopolymorpha alba]|uniref:beta-N-acetylhexosaminidase n=1 Tax=Actinopolymorpha alba TaxID=533267 RepID=UPI000367691B|nr:glycoside hydrolase family 20 zincin-like fold domain-containing protein [Actinopolymorpha alba]
MNPAATTGATALSLLPCPRTADLDPGHCSLTADPIAGPASQRRIVIEAADAGELLATARRLRDAIRTIAGVDWEISATTVGPAHEVGAILRLNPDSAVPDQGYELSITPERLLVEAGTPQGVFYGVCTLIQVIEQSAPELPCLRISDWPDHAARGVMLDVSRDKVPTMETVYALIDLLAGWKINQIQLYTEHTFAYRRHPEVWANASPFTGEEILALDAYCKERHIELVPNQNSFGHMHRWLELPRYAPLGEVSEGFVTPWGEMRGPFSLAPGDPGSLELVKELYDELLPHFSSKQFNVGCDETFDLGQGRTKELCEEQGTGRVYLDFLLKIYAEVTARGYTMQFWGDIIEQHPELIPELPKDAVALGWGYEADHPFGTLCERYAAAGVAFYTCPGTSSWNSIAGRSKNALGNLLSAAENGLRHGATGYLITDWGDRGHWQVLPVSYLGYAAGAAYSWDLESNRDLDVAEATSWHAFKDPTGSLGRLAYDLGNVYTKVGIEPHNSSVLFWILQSSMEKLATNTHAYGPRVGELSPDTLRESLAAVDEAMGVLDAAQSTAADAELVREEFLNTARLLRHACRRGLLALGAEGGDDVRRELAADLEGIIEEYNRLWLARNRPGGLSDSVRRLENLRPDYADA